MSAVDPLSSQPPLPRLAETAFFFDFDGTLCALAPTPDAVQVADPVPAALRALVTATHGAVAIVTGRPIADIDHFLSPLTLPIAGSHGAELRRGSHADSDVVRVGFGDPRLAEMRAAIEPILSANPGLFLEIKGAGFAVHYRAVPQLGELIEREIGAAVARANLAGEAFGLQLGKMVVEVKPHGVDKGKAIALLLEQAPFAGRKPFFAGDDVTDEKGFATVNALGGMSMKIGEGETIATARLPDVETFAAWLTQVVAG